MIRGVHYNNGFDIVAEHACGKDGKGFAWLFQSVAAGRQGPLCSLLLWLLVLPVFWGAHVLMGWLPCPQLFLQNPPPPPPSNRRGAAVCVHVTTPPGSGRWLARGHLNEAPQSKPFPGFLEREQPSPSRWLGQTVWELEG